MTSTFITFPCPSCYNELFANNNFIGKVISCSRCGHSAEVPCSSIPYTREQERLRDSYSKDKSKQHRSDSSNDSKRHTHSSHNSGNEQRQDDNSARAQTIIKDERYYGSVLGLKGSVTFADVQRLYKQLVIQYHPDKVSHLGPKLRTVAEQEMKEINAAFEHFKRKYGKQD